MPFTCQKLDIPDLLLIQPKIFKDDRGFFMETYKSTDFTQLGMDQLFRQDNFSHSSKGTLRGLHYQLPPYEQGKLIMVTHGEVFDVAVDIRKKSSTFGKWVGVRLSSENPRIFYIPPGFAHGFCVLSDEADFTYKVTSEYDIDSERGIIWNDPAIGIDWPIADPRLSERDRQLPKLEAVTELFL
ncbi:MAG: dTDP-4-dehydrorhamnose 3,5-epimerase [candidate division KSB1 bacterium]|jgi:dTDP-4-dehydrorhamnose 3,5-epimerase|nr:dTDP-4-dehydrorhamnose 3,5-epimerase [candidate division KSB1 bacterium]